MTKPDPRIDYIEFPATDIEATKTFYSDVFGWAFTDYGPAYISFEGAGVTGGFALESEVATVINDGPLTEDNDRRTNGVLVVLYASDLEGIMAKVEQSGAPIARDIFSFPGGRRFHFMDPNGNELAVWSE